MKLAQEEQDILNGSQGKVKQQAMKILVQYGEAEEKEIKIHCRKAYLGHAAGEAIVTNMTLGTWKIIDEKTGVITANGSDMYGKSIKGAVVLFPCGKGA